MSNSEEILTVQGLCVRYFDAQALGDIDLSVKRGEVVGIVGESGSGKSTLLKAIAGLLPKTAKVTSGSVELDGIDLLDRDGKEMRGSEIGFLFQDTEGSFDPLFTIKKQFDEVMGAHRRKPKNRDEWDCIQRKALDLVGLRDADRILSSLPSELSGGMCQRVALAMILALSPDILLADEPTSALDVASQKRVMDILRALNAEEGLSILMVSHDIDLIGSIADRIVVMHNGRIVEEGLTAQVMNDPVDPYTRELIAATPHLEGQVDIEALGTCHAS